MTIPKNSNTIQPLQDTVLAGSYCIGCGVCAKGLDSSPVRIGLDDFGMFQAQPSPSYGASSIDPSVGETCPFSGLGPNEDQVGAELFGDQSIRDPWIGFHRSCYAGSVAEDSFRAAGSSGGIASWILCELLGRGLVDHVVHVRPRQPSSDDARLFSYQVSNDIVQVKDGAKSRYYPVELSNVLRFIRHNPGRYALVALPCFIKAIRLLSRREPLFADRIRFCVGLFCGHLKSAAFSEMFAWHLGIAPKSIQSIDFRWKRPDSPAWDYGVKVAGLAEVGEVSRECAVRDVLYADWGMGFFKYNACDYCDDVVAELADISIGDAWLLKYAPDWQGTNMLIARNPQIDEILQIAIADGRLRLESVDAQTVAASQEGGFRHRRQDLEHRLFLAEKAGVWHPPKRVHSKEMLQDVRRRSIIELRMRLARQSHLAWRDAVKRYNMHRFERTMAPLLRQYSALYASPVQPVSPDWKRMFGPFRPILGRIKKWIAF